MKDIIDIDTTNWPSEANLVTWTKLLGVSHLTTQKYRRLGKLPGKRKLDGSLLISKETVLRAFRIQAR